MGVGLRIKNTRKKNKLTQTELAEKIGVHEVTVRTWENTDKGPNLTVMPFLAAALNTTVAYLVGETDDPKRPEPALPTESSETTTNIAVGVSSPAFVQGVNHGSLIATNRCEQILSDEASELVRIYGLLDVKRRIDLLSKAFALENEAQKSK